MSQKKTIIIGASIIVLLFVVGFVVFLLIKPKIAEKLPSVLSGEVPEDVLKSLTAPAGKATEVPADVLKSLTSPAGKPKTVPKDVLDSLTAPAK